ncbi:serine/threonine protein kinase [Pyxidicoccus parkwayensis]|uniref:Serine/threonine protein kinase n=1 Tax=Pyxidicoccus parkwayensis TaxID=2813578 RepID=A0ABX7NQR9_9BACT|nr:serine/threonine-protein kinase [Pyxidicoccus parkwaysis]QSQ21197.1 serine/threonine protein kinase [Pyxidicoccus parkwaysis]
MTDTRKAGRRSALGKGVEQLSRDLSQSGFSAGAVELRFVRLLEERGNGEQVLLFERSLRHGLSGPVVVKRLRNPESFPKRERLREEVSLAFRLHHPAIAQVHHFRVIDGAPHVIMEHVDGPSLDALITVAVMRNHPLPRAFALYVAAEVADALHHAHTLSDPGEGGRPLGIIHRDVSPRNIRVERRTGQVKLTDFGAAYSKRVGREETPERLLKGDLMYASPEYLLGAPMDARSDLFSLGLVLLEALTNRHLFGFWLGQEDPPAETAVPHARADEAPDVPLEQMLSLMKRYTQEDVERAAATLPEGLQALVRRALQREPSLRHASAEELGSELRAQLHALRPGYGRREAADDMARVISDASAMRDVGEPLEGALYPAGLDEHELMPGTATKPR